LKLSELEETSRAATVEVTKVSWGLGMTC
jgi:hypothetical protein